MTWVKIDDHMSEHPKVVMAGPLASWLHVCALSYSSRQRTDGFIPKAMIRRLVSLENAFHEADKLVASGIWKQTEGGYQIIDFLGCAIRRSPRSRSALRRAWESIAHKVRPVILARDGYQCRWCGSGERLQVDHVIPIAMGGTSDADNLQTLCRPCNLRKGGN